MQFEVRDVSGWPVADQESVGDDPKEWLIDPDAAPHMAADPVPNGALWLYKPIKVGVATGYRRYDDGAERVASALAACIGLPAAEVQLAFKENSAGVISRNVTPDGWEDQPGDTVLSEIPGYLSCAGDSRPKERVGHNLENIADVLRGALGPVGVGEDTPGFAVFAGFLVFDAWIANTDRHALNWAVLERQDDGARRLAASFDHGSALGSGVRDDDLATHDARAFARRGRASRFEGGRNTSLVELAHAAVRMAGQPAQEWLTRIIRVSPEEVDAILWATPTLSDARRRFMAEILNENQRRLAA